jgi:hypothetical protein
MADVVADTAALDHVTSLGWPSRLVKRAPPPREQ